jgi:3-phosphoshikimate 1-carboxyvinyltransferase
MSTVTVEGGRGPLRGRLRVPGDKSISHRALLLGALAEGRSRITGLSRGEDVTSTAVAVQAMGASFDGEVIHGGRSRLDEPEHVIDVGNSGTGIRLLAGICAGLPWLTVLQGDRSISRRPMDRVAEPLRKMGAKIDGREQGRLPPLVVRGGNLRGIDLDLAVASAQVKGAVLLAGLSAEGSTVVRERVPTRAHSEEMLAACGADIAVSDDGLTTTLRPSRLEPFELDVPGDPSQAAFWIVAACLVPDSEVTVEHVYVGRARAGFLDVLRRMGAAIDIEPTGPHTATVTARHSPDLHGTDIGGQEVPGLIDEIPVLAVAAAVAEGPTEVRDAAELRVKESDRVTTTVALLAAMGVGAEARPDGFQVRGGARLTPGIVRSAGDHRIAMAGVVAALVAQGPTRIAGWGAVRTSYPGFEDDLSALQSGPPRRGML